MITAFVAGVSVWGPGLEGWPKARDVLAGAASYQPGETPLPAPTMLPANERRRTGTVVRLALEVARGATEASGLDPRTLNVVFGSSNGDSPVVHDVLESVTGGERPVSPTQFHNSVHNAAAGYWSIATGATTPATTLGCYDDTVAASLLKTGLEASVERRPVLLCVYDAPIPGPLGTSRPTGSVFGAGFVLTPERRAGALAELRLAYRAGGAAADAMQPRRAELRPLVSGNAAARALRLLETLALREADTFALPYLDGRLDLAVTPC